MPTIPTGRLERELRALYLRWLSRITVDSANISDAVDAFERAATALIEKEGGRVAGLGALADFPAPKRLDLSPVAGVVYDEMKQAAIQAGISLGLGATDTAKAMFAAGMDKSFNRLNRLARTETVRAYWLNAWGSVSDLPDIVMVWGAEDGPRTCEWCRERDGLVIASDVVRDHPYGRCTPVPTLRSRVQYRGSVDRDGSIFHDPLWNTPRVAEAQSGLRAMSASEANLWGAQNMLDVKTLPEDVQQQIVFYTGGGYKGTNRSLRQGAFTGSNGTVQREMVNGLDKAMKVSKTPEDVVVSRVVHLDAFPGNDPSALLGKTIQDKGYLSTAVGGRLKGAGFNMAQVEMTIQVPAGTSAIWTRPLSQFKNERELLLDRNTKLRISEATFNGRTGKWLVQAVVER